MHPAANSRLAYSPALGTECSFPERHFTTGDSEPSTDWPSPSDVASLTGTDPCCTQTAVVKPQSFEPNFVSLLSQGWPSQSQPLLHQNLIPSQAPLVEATDLFSIPLRQSASPVRAEWPLFREQSPNGLFWNSTPADFGHDIEDDSDSIQSPNENPEEPCAPLPTWPPVQKPRRRSMPGVITGPGQHTRAPASNQTHHSTAPSERGCAPYFGLGLESLQLHSSDVAAAPFVERPNAIYDNPITEEGETDMIFQDAPDSSSSKANSKRIAHKLSEKSRRKRLTMAIREIQKLLPAGGENRDQSQSRSQQDADFVVRPGIPNSKLDVVEMAVGFIKDLKEKNVEMARRVREAEDKLGQCRCRRAGEGATADAVELSTSNLQDTTG
ncbi:hypothetical protein VTK56DRAFT_7537 [Thermocarpiscus australiensis]